MITYFPQPLKGQGLSITHSLPDFVKIMNKSLKYVIQGIALALLVFLCSSSLVSVMFTDVHAQGAPLFSVTLIAPTGGNAVRRQYASIIASNMIELGIEAKLFYVSFDVLINRMYFTSVKQGAPFDQGGFDMGFVNWVFSPPTPPIPDFAFMLDGKPGFFAPAGNNYVLYNNTELNALFDQLGKTTDTQQQVNLEYKIQEIVAYDKPYNFLYQPVDVIPRGQKWTAWGGKDVYSVMTFPDVQQWAGGTALTFAEASNVFPGNTLNPAVTASSTSNYALNIYSEICFAGAGLQDLNGGSLSFYPALATSIQPSQDGLDWNLTIRHGALFQSGVEITADDFVWTRWALLAPQTGATSLGTDIQYLGNVVDFTFLNGTTTTVDNRASANEAVRHGWWKATGKYSFEFHLPDPYAFTKQTYGAFAPLPKHILEKFPSSTWDSISYSTANAPYKYTWDTKQYGGSGSYTAVGPVGAGPYILQNYDFTNNIATLVKFPGYWNATGLESIGRFTVDTYKVVWISDKDSALAALKSGEVDVLDSNYQLAKDKSTLQQMGVNIISAPEFGWAEQGFNMEHPILGTGVDTPLGKSDPSKAAEAARDVRTAISHMIPRDLIISQLLAGSGYSLATMVGPGWGIWENPNIKPDSYDLNAAAQELQAAGYSVSVGPPPAQIAYTGSPMLGSGSITINGLVPAAHLMIIIQQSTDGGQTWTNVAAAVSDNSSKYQVSAPAPPAFGTVWYRANFTGYVLNDTMAANAITSGITPDQVNEYISSGQYFGGRPLLPGSVTEPISVSSSTTDTTIVGAIVVILVVLVGAAVWLSRRKKTKAPKT